MRPRRPIRLRLLHRDLRVIRGGTGRASSSRLRRAPGLAAAIVSRYRRLAGLARRLGLVFEQRWPDRTPGVFARHYHRHTQVRLSPRLQLIVARPTAAAPAVQAAAARQPRVSRADEREPLEVTVLRRAQTLVRRAGEHGRRVETMPVHTPPAHLGGPGEPTAQRRASDGATEAAVGRPAHARGVPLAYPVPMIVPARSVAADAVPGLEGMGIPGLPGRPPSPAPAVDEGSTRERSETIDVRRLADDVIEAIDARIVAERERLGRI
jgi:hypothetical protein